MIRGGQARDRLSTAVSVPDGDVACFCNLGVKCRPCPKERFILNIFFNFRNLYGLLFT